MTHHVYLPLTRRWLWRSLVALTAATIAVLPLTTSTNSVGAASASPAAATGWSVLKSKNTGSQTQFNAIGALSPSDVWAVGSSGVPEIDRLAVIEHGNGSAWSLVPSPNPPGAILSELLGVSGTSSTDVWAVGDFTLSSGFGGPLLLHWNGAAWSVVTTPPGSEPMSGVDAIAPNDAWAVGGHVAEHWDGHTWSTFAVPVVRSDTQLQGVTVISPTDAWAVGESLDNVLRPHSLIVHWNGTAWSMVKSPNTGPSSQLFSVSAVSSNDIWAVGQGFKVNTDTLTEHWNGSTWTVVPGPNAPLAQLTGVAAVSSTDVWAVGVDVVGGGPTGNMMVTLAEKWDGSKWTVSSTPRAGFAESSFNAVASTSKTIFAAGSVVRTNGITDTTLLTLAETHPS